MDRELAFSTFLKLLELPRRDKAATLRGFKRAGGFNYWRPMTKLAPKVAKGSLDLSDIQEEVGNLAKGHQRKYNINALTNLLKWTSRRRLTMRKSPGRLVKEFGSTGLKVRIEPELSFAMQGNEYLVHLWATTNPTLSEETLSMGLFFFRYHFRKNGYENHRYLILDTVKDRMFSEVGIIDHMPDMLREQGEILSSLWADINREIERAREKGADDHIITGPGGT